MKWKICRIVWHINFTAFLILFHLAIYYQSPTIPVNRQIIDRTRKTLPKRVFYVFFINLISIWDEIFHSYCEAIFYTHSVFHSLAISPAVGKFHKKRLFFRIVFFLGAGAGFEPTTSGLWARRATRLLYPAIYRIGAGDRNRTGTGNKSHRILSPGRLPVPPLRQAACFLLSTFI